MIHAGSKGVGRIGVRRLRSFENDSSVGAEGRDAPPSAGIQSCNFRQQEKIAGKADLTDLTAH
jgi:hypothetical protein